MTLLRISVRRKSAGILQPTAKQAGVSTASKLTAMLLQAYTYVHLYLERPNLCRKDMHKQIHVTMQSDTKGHRSQ